MMIATAGISQIYRIAKIADAFKTGNPKRAKDGYYSIHVPYGYIKIDKTTVKVDEVVSPLLLQFVEWFLQGVSLSEIVRRGDASGIPPRDAQHWNSRGVEYILKNPYYAGKTFYGRGRRNERGLYYLNAEPPQLYDGKHVPLWTFDTYLSIIAEFERRRELRTQPKDYNLTGLLKCSECGATLHLIFNKGKSINSYWNCAGHQESTAR